MAANLKLDPDDPASYSGGKPAGRGIITDAGYAIWAFPPSEGNKPFYKTFAFFEIAFDGKDRLWREHQYVAFCPGDKMKAGLVPSMDGVTPAGGSIEDIIDLREGRRTFDPIPFVGPDVASIAGGTFADDSELRMNLRAAKDASMRAAADNSADILAGKPGTRFTLPPGVLDHTSLAWMVGLDAEFSRIEPEPSTRRKTRKTGGLLGEKADEKKDWTPAPVLCATALFGIKTAEEVAALRAQLIAAEATAKEQAGQTQPAGAMSGPAGLGSSAPATPAATSVLPAGVVPAGAKKTKKLAIDPALQATVDGLILTYLVSEGRDDGPVGKGLKSRLAVAVNNGLKAAGLPRESWVVGQNYLQTLESGPNWEVDGSATGMVTLTDQGMAEAVVASLG